METTKKERNNETKMSKKMFPARMPLHKKVIKTSQHKMFKSAVWDPTLQTQITALEQVQTRAARYVCNDFTSRTPGCVTKMLNNLNWEPLKVRRKHDRLSMLYKIRHNFVDIHTDRYLRVSDSRIRGPAKFFQERIVDTAYSNSFFPRTVRDWNRLSGEVVFAASLEEFRSLLLRSYLLHNTRQFNSVNSFNQRF